MCVSVCDCGKTLTNTLTCNGMCEKYDWIHWAIYAPLMMQLQSVQKCIGHVTPITEQHHSNAIRRSDNLGEIDEMRAPSLNTSIAINRIGAGFP